MEFHFANHLHAARAWTISVLSFCVAGIHTFIHGYNTSMTSPARNEHTTATLSARNSATTRDPSPVVRSFVRSFVVVGARGTSTHTRQRCMIKNARTTYLAQPAARAEGAHETVFQTVACDVVPAMRGEYANDDAMTHNRYSQMHCSFHASTFSTTLSRQWCVHWHGTVRAIVGRHVLASLRAGQARCRG